MESDFDIKSILYTACNTNYDELLTWLLNYVQYDDKTIVVAIHRCYKNNNVFGAKLLHTTYPNIKCEFIIYNENLYSKT